MSDAQHPFPPDPWPGSPPDPAPEGPPAGVDPQQWLAWWWQTYGYTRADCGPAPYAQTSYGPPQWVVPPQPGQAQWVPPQQGQAQWVAGPWGYPQFVYPEDALPPRRRHRGLAALLAFLLLLVVVVPAATSVALLLSHAARSGPTADAVLAQSGPLPSGDRRFTPSPEQRAFFLEVGATADKGTRVARWTRPTVRVAILGESTPADRRVVNEILATVNETVDKPRFVYSNQDPQIVISFLGHAEFEAASSRADDTIGWCETNYLFADHSISGAEISVDDSSEFRDSREEVLYHEFGHALGLDDTRKDRYAGVVMYFRISDSHEYTRLDLAAIRMLYDSRTQAGATQRQLARAWPAE